MALQPVMTHAWDLSPREARALQQALQVRVVVEPLACPPETVAGIDVSVKAGRARAAVVLLRYPTMAPLEAAVAELPVAYPYVPGLLTFREGPAVLAALARLRAEPDVLMFDAHGLAHPRRMGLAAHLGVLLDTPAVGCAKSRLVGAYDLPASEKGAWQPLTDGDEVIGAVVRSRTGVRPLFVSVGHRADLGTSIALVLGCCTRYRLPEPTRWAHMVAGGATLPNGG